MQISFKLLLIFGFLFLLATARVENCSDGEFDGEMDGEI